MAVQLLAEARLVGKAQLLETVLQPLVTARLAEIALLLVRAQLRPHLHQAKVQRALNLPLCLLQLPEAETLAAALEVALEMAAHLEVQRAAAVAILEEVEATAEVAKEAAQRQLLDLAMAVQAEAEMEAALEEDRQAIRVVAVVLPEATLALAEGEAAKEEEEEELMEVEEEAILVVLEEVEMEAVEEAAEAVARRLPVFGDVKSVESVDGSEKQTEPPFYRLNPYNC